MKRIIREVSFRGNVRNYGTQNRRGEYTKNYRIDSYGRSRNRSRDRSFSTNYGNNRTRGTSNSRPRSGSRAGTNRDRIHSYKCREYDHFTRDCPTSRGERVCTTYLQRSDRSKSDKLKVEESFPISGHGYTSGKLLDGTECQLLLDTGASKLFMSKSFYMQCMSLPTLPKFASKTQRIQVGNGQFVSVLFIIPVITDVHRHRFKIYTLVSEIHENVDLAWDCCFKFLNRSLPIFLKECVIIKP